MRILRLTAVNIRKIVSSPGFYACAVLTFILCFSVQIHFDISSQHKYSVLESFMAFKRSEMLLDTDFCSYNILYNATGSWLKTFIPILAAVPYIPLLCNERLSGSGRYASFRMSKMESVTGNYLSALLSGGLAILFGFLLFTAAVFIMFPNIKEYDAVLRESFEWWLPGVYPYFDRLGYPYLVILRFIEVFVYGAVSAIPAFLLTCFMKNKYLILCIPFFIKDLVTLIYFRLYYVAHEDMFNPKTKLLSFMNITHPDSVSQILSKGKETWKILLLHMGLLMIGYLIYVVIMNRRVDYGE